MLGAWLVFGEKLGQRKICGIVLSLAGAVIVALSGKELGGREGMWGELLTCGCVLSWMCYTLLARKALDRIPPLTATAYSTFAGTIVLVICAAPSTSAAKLASLSLTVWLALVFLGLLAVTLAFKWYIPQSSSGICRRPISCHPRRPAAAAEPAGRLACDFRTDRHPNRCDTGAAALLTKGLKNFRN